MVANKLSFEAAAAKLGLRFGELVTLEWNDVDLANKVVRISRKETFNPKGRGRKDRKPRERIIPMPDDIAQMFSELPRTNKKVFLKKGNILKRVAFLISMGLSIAAMPFTR